MEAVALSTDVASVNDFSDDDKPDDSEIDFTHYELQIDGTRTIVDVAVGRSLDVDLTIPLSYIVVQSFTGPPSEEAVQMARLRGQDEDDIPDFVSGVSVFHADEDGNVGLTLYSERAEDEEVDVGDVTDDFLDELMDGADLTDEVSQ